jgi:hypothetical protein
MAITTNVPWDPESLKLPAVLVNRFQITPFGTHLRVSFAEIVKPSPTSSEIVSYRFVAMITVDDATQLAQVLMTAVSSLAAAQPPAPSPPKA